MSNSPRAQARRTNRSHLSKRGRYLLAQQHEGNSKGLTLQAKRLKVGDAIKEKIMKGV